MGPGGAVWGKKTDYEKSSETVPLKNCMEMNCLRLALLRRLIMKTNSLPSWGRHFFTASRVAVIEECVVDPAQPRLTW